MRQTISLCAAIAGPLFLVGCDSAPPAGPALTPAGREQIVNERQQLMTEQASSLNDIVLTVPFGTVSPEEVFQVEGTFATKDPAQFEERPPRLRAQVINEDGAIEWTKRLEVTEQQGTYSFSGELRSPPRPGRYEVRLIYIGADDSTLAKVPLTVGAPK